MEKSNGAKIEADLARGKARREIRIYVRFPLPFPLF